MNYILGTGYCHRPDVAKAEQLWALWRTNTDTATPSPRRIVVMAVGGAVPPEPTSPDMDVIRLSGNLGHIHHLIGKELPYKPYGLSGWSASVLALALIAYNDEADLLYKEADCLAFGPWVAQMYGDLAGGDIVFGGPMKSDPWMSSTQSLFLVRHKAIIPFVAKYLGFGNDSETLLPEDKFARLGESPQPMDVRHLSFGVDRERPIPFDAPVFYVQQPTDGDFESLRQLQLI